jgi:hypothetical protein
LTDDLKKADSVPWRGRSLGRGSSCRCSRLSVYFLHHGLWASFVDAWVEQKKKNGSRLSPSQPSATLNQPHQPSHGVQIVTFRVCHQPPTTHVLDADSRPSRHGTAPAIRVSPVTRPVHGKQLPGRPANHGRAWMGGESRGGGPREPELRQANGGLNNEADGDDS